MEHKRILKNHYNSKVSWFPALSVCPMHTVVNQGLKPNLRAAESRLRCRQDKTKVKVRSQLPSPGNGRSQMCYHSVREGGFHLRATFLASRWNCTAVSLPAMAEVTLSWGPDNGRAAAANRPLEFPLHHSGLDGIIKGKEMAIFQEC